MMQQYPQAQRTPSQSMFASTNPNGMNTQPPISQSSYPLPSNVPNQQNAYASQMASGLPQNNLTNATYPAAWSNNPIGQNQGVSQLQNSFLGPIGQSGSIPNQQLSNPSMVTGSFQPISQFTGAESSQPKDQSPQKLTMEPEAEPIVIKDAVTYLSSNIFQERIEGVEYSYFLAEKQNASGIKFNTRFFLVGPNKLGYSTHFNPKELKIPIENLGKFPLIKKRYDWQDITLENPKKELMKIHIQTDAKDKNVKDKDTWVLRAIDKDANMMLQIYTLLYETQENKKLRIKAAQQTLETIKQSIPNALAQGSNQPVNPYQSPSLPSQSQQQQIQPLSGQSTSNVQGELMKTDSMQGPQMTSQFGTQPTFNNFNSNQVGSNQPNHFDQPSQLNQFGQVNQINQISQQNQFSQLSQFNQPSQTIGNSMGQTDSAYRSAPNYGQQAPFIQSGQQPLFQQPNNQQFSNAAFGQPLTETQMLKETFKKLDSQSRSNQRDNLPVMMNSVQVQSAVYQDFRRNFINDVEQRKKLLYTDNQNWNYQLLKGDEENVEVNFKMFAEALVADIIDDMNERQPNYRASEDLSETQSIITYRDCQGVEVRLCLTAVKEYKLLKQTKESVYDQSAIKAAFREFNNMDYLMQLTRNKGKIRVPLAAIVEYKGIIALVKDNIPVDNSKAPTSVLKELELLSRESRIKDSIFEDDRAIVIAPLQSKLYEKLAREQNSTILRQPNAFDIYYLDKVRHFLPADLQFASKDPENYILRQEFIQRQEFSDTSFLGENLKKYLGKQKVPKEIQQSIRQLDESEKVIVKIVNDLAKDLEETEQIIIGSEDFSRLFHKNGLNIRYIGLLYSNTTASFIRKACMAEIAARSTKSVLQYDLQSIVKNSMMSKKNNHTDACSATDAMLDYAIDFLNSVTGNTQDSSEIWTRINKQALYEFNVPLIKQDIAEGHFVLALLHHCNIKCNYRYDLGDKLFIRNIFDRTKDTVFSIKSRVYSLKFTDLYRRVQAILTSQADDSFDQLKSLLNLRKADIPQHMRLDNTFNEVAVYLAGIVPPKYKEMMQDSLPCSSLYQMAKRQMPSLASFQIALTEIKWDLKYDREEDALSKKDQLQRKITRWCGDVHPTLTDLYNVFAVYYINKCKFEEAMKYAKSSLANNSNLLGNNSLKTAESHYELANVFIKASKKEEALIYFRKAKNIYDNRHATQRLSYAYIQIKIATLDLQFDKFEEAEAFALHAITIFELVEGHQTQLVQAYELISRIYEVTNRREQLIRIAEYCGQLLSDINDQSNLERMIKIAILPILNDLPAGLAGKLSLLVQTIPYQYNSSNPTNALNYLKGFIQKGIFMNKFKDYINDVEQIILIINNNGLLARWRGLQSQIKTGEQEFIAIMESLVYLLGQGFISGALNDQ